MFGTPPWREQFPEEPPVEQVPCPYCGGDGLMWRSRGYMRPRVRDAECGECSGTGKVSERTVRIANLKRGLFRDVFAWTALGLVAAVVVYTVLTVAIYSWRYPSMTQREILLRLPEVVTWQDLDE